MKTMTTTTLWGTVVVSKCMSKINVTMYSCFGKRVTNKLPPVTKIVGAMFFWSCCKSSQEQQVGYRPVQNQKRQFFDHAPQAVPGKLFFIRGCTRV
jgi:hypothetical protein